HLDPTVRIEITGLRPAEKLHEALVSQSEITEVREHPRVIHTLPPPSIVPAPGGMAGGSPSPGQI
ncbi:MAG: polysaccharide biosynthesis protein, partial [Sulfitobacter sp.]|nr:polysaccharide biosynthesis protein [Sulfitobacter sp.]